MTRTTRRRLLLGVGVAGSLALLGFLLLRSPWVEGWIAGAVVAEIDKQTFERASVGRARVTLWPPGLELQDLRIVHHLDDDVILEVESARAGLAIRDGRVKLGRITAIRPRLTLHLEKDGKLREFRRPEETPKGEGKPLTELPWGSVEVVDARISLAIPNGEIAVDGLHLEPVFGTITDIRGTLDVRWRDFRDGGAFSWPRVALGPDRIEIPALTLDLRTLDARGAGWWPLGRELEATVEVDGDLAELTPLLKAPRTLDGTFILAIEGGGPLTDPEARVRLHVADLEYTAPGRVWPTLRYRLDEVMVEAVATRSGVKIEQLDAREDDGHIRGSGLVERLDRGLGPRWELVESTLFVDDLSLAAALRAGGAAPNPWVDFVGDGEVHLTGPLAPLQLDGPFAITVREFAVTQGPVDVPTSPSMLDIPRATLDGRISVYADHLVLDADRLVAGENRGSVLADIGFGGQGPLDLRFDLPRADLSVLRPLNGSALFGVGTLSGRLAGPFNGLRANGRGVIRGFSVGGVPYADTLDARITSDMKRLWLDEVAAVKGKTPYTGRFSMDFARGGLPMSTEVALEGGRVEDLIGIFLDLGDLVTGRVDRGRLTLDGPLNDLDGAADLRLSEVTLLGETFPTGHAAGRMHGGTFTLDDLSVRRGADEGLTLRGSVGRAWALDMVAAGELRLETLDALKGAGLDLGGRGSVLMKIDNTLFDPAPYGRARLWATTLDDRPLPDSVLDVWTREGILYGAGGLLGESASVTLSAGLWGDQPYDVRAHLDELPIDRLAPFAADGQPIEARLTGDVAISGTGGETPSPVRIRAVFPEARLAWDRHVLRSDPERPWRLRLDGDRWSIRDVALRGDGGRITLEAQGTPEAALLDGAARLDADLLRAVTPGLRGAEGVVDVSFTSRGGRQTRVDVTLDAPLMRHEALPAPLEDVVARAVLAPDRFLVTDFAAGLGGGTVIGDARRVPRIAERFPGAEGRPLGVIEAKDWIPTRFDLLGRADDVQLQWVDDLPPAVGDAKLAFDGPADATLLHADIDVAEMAFTERIDWEDWVVALEDWLLVEAPPTDEPPWFGLDIGIRADRTVRLLNNVSDATASADLKLIGDTSRMGLVGRVRVDEGVIFLQDRAFDVLRGELRFDDPYAWDPLVDFDLRTDIQSRARQYRINYRISGPYSAWSSRTVSEPRLPQADINTLLWFGVTADELEDMGELTSAVGMAAADFVFKDFVQNDYLGLGLRDAGLFDRLPAVELNTGVNLRGEYSSEPRALIRQRWSPTLSTLAEINLVRDDHFARLDWRTDESLVLSAWWASRRREGFALPVSGALGADVRWVIELD
jgi:hypothetical protein